MIQLGNLGDWPCLRDARKRPENRAFSRRIGNVAVQLWRELWRVCATGLRPAVNRGGPMSFWCVRTCRFQGPGADLPETKWSSIMTILSSISAAFAPTNWSTMVSSAVQKADASSTSSAATPSTAAATSDAATPASTTSGTQSTHHHHHHHGGGGGSSSATSGSTSTSATSTLLSSLGLSGSSQTATSGATATASNGQTPQAGDGATTTFYA